MRECDLLPNLLAEALPEKRHLGRGHKLHSRAIIHLRDHLEHIQLLSDVGPAGKEGWHTIREH